MIGVTEIVCVSVMSVMTGLSLLSAAGANGLRKRIVRTPTQTAASVATARQAGVAELAGRLEAAGEPLTALDGVAAVAKRWAVAYRYVDPGESKAYDSVAGDITETVEIEVVDASGSCVLTCDQVLLFAPSRDRTYPAAQAKENEPELWKVIQAAVKDHPGRKIREVRVTEWVIPAGTVGFVSGHITAAPPPVGHGYRAHLARVAVTGSLQRPTVVSAWPEADVLAMLGRPIRRLRIVAVVALALAAMTIGYALAIGRASGL